MNWCCADPVPHVLPLKLPFATHLRFPNPTVVDPSSKPSPSRRLTFAVSFPLPSFPPFQRPSLLYLFFSTIITLPGMSATSLSLSPRLSPLRTFTPSYPSPPLYNCFPRYLSILFTRVAFTLANIAKLPRTSETRWSLIRQTNVGIRVGIYSERG